MNFKRKQRIKGKTAKHYKEWYDEAGRYRISWRDQVEGISMKPGYFACVRCLRGREDDFKYWGFAGRRGPYKTYKAAMEACEFNQRIWEKFLAIEGRAKVTQVRNLEARAFVGKGKTTHSVLRELPVWVAQQASPRLLEILCGNAQEKDQSDPIEISTNSSEAASPTMTPGESDTSGSGPVSSVPAPDTDESGIVMNRTSSDAKPAKAQVKARKKPAAKRTVKRSPVGKRKRKSTTASKC